MGRVLLKSFLNCTTTSRLLYLLDTIVALHTLAQLSTLNTSAAAFAVLFLTVRFLAVASSAHGLQLRELATRCGYNFFCLFSFWRFALVIMFLVVVTTNAYTLFWTSHTLGKTLAVHFQTFCFLTMTTLLAWNLFLNVLLRYLINLAQLVSVFLLWTLLKKIDVMRMVANYF